MRTAWKGRTRDLGAFVINAPSTRCRMAIARTVTLAALAGGTLYGCADLQTKVPWNHPPPAGQATAANTPLAKPAPPEPATRHKPPVREVKPAEKIAMVEPDTLVGLGPSAVGDLLGKPTRTVRSAMSVQWTYATPRCSLDVFFFPDIKTGAFRALKYGFSQANGSPAGDVRGCMHLILAARTNESG